MRDMIKSGLVLMLFSLIAGAALAFVYLKTAPVILARKEALARAVMLAVLPGMEGGYTEENADGDFPYWTGYTDAEQSNPGGHVFIALGKGYSSTIETMVGVDMEGKVAGIMVISHQETPGIGDKILDIKAGEETPWFTNQYIGKSADDNLMLADDGGVIDGISGATVSSKALTGSMINGLGALRALLTGTEFVAVEMPEEEEIDPSEMPLSVPEDGDLTEVMPRMMGGYVINEDEDGFPYWTAYNDEDQTDIGGYLFVARKEGFAHNIDTLVGVDSDMTIWGIKILFHQETPDYGELMEEVRDGEDEPWFTSQFIEKSINDNLSLKDDGGVIDGITDATVSSEAFATSIQNGLAHLNAILSGEEFVQEEEEMEDEGSDIDPEEWFEDIMPAMFGGYEIKNEDSDNTYWIAWRDPDQEEVGGYLFVAKKEGYDSVIRTLIAVEPDLTIIGAAVIYHEETEDWGDKIVEIRDDEDEPWFTQQFIGKSSPDTIALVEDGGEIDAITDATVTSEAVTSSVQEGILRLKASLSGEEYVAKEADDDDDEEEEEGEDHDSDSDDDDDEVVVMERIPVEDMLSSIFPEKEIDFNEDDSDFPYYTAYDDVAMIEPVGYAFVVTRKGFEEDIETFVAVDIDGFIINATILYQNETEDWGSYVIEVRDGEDEPWFTAQFEGKSIDDDLSLADDGGLIDAISEATETSNVVAGSIAEGLAALMEIIQ